MVKGVPMHIKAKASDIAERVIVSGDSQRVIQLSKMLDNAKVVNENRGYIAYTGRYEKKDITVACHGIGAPSIAIVIEELIMLGAKDIIRLGTVGGLRRDMKYGDILIANGAFSGPGGVLAAYAKNGFPIPTVPSFSLFDTLVRASIKSKTKVYIGPVVSSDAFYAEDDNVHLQKKGYLGIEMEASILFAISSIRGVNSAALFMISNNLISNTTLIDAKELAAYLDNAADIALRALVNI